MTLPALTDVAYAEVNHGRWVARCPYRWCSSAMQVWPGQEQFECDGAGSCGAVADLVWPPDPQAIATILAMRPTAEIRHWQWNEPIEHLLQENAAHGMLPPQWKIELGPGEQMVVADIQNERVTGGLLLEQLAAADPQRAIGA